MATRVERLEFRVQEPQSVVQQMDRLGEAHSGWVNLRPSLDPEDEPATPRGIGALFSSAVHDAPMCTWVAGRLQRHGIEPDSLGIQHAAGPRAFAHLASLGVPVPEGWRRMQDHPRRGLVLLAPAGTDHYVELDWLLGAATLLSRVELKGSWICDVHSRA